MVIRVIFFALSSTNLFSFVIFLASARLTLANVMDKLHSNYLVPGTTCMVEMLITGSQYHQTIATLWLSHLVDDIQIGRWWVLTSHLPNLAILNRSRITWVWSFRSLIFHITPLQNCSRTPLAQTSHFTASTLSFSFALCFFWSRPQSRTSIHRRSCGSVSSAHRPDGARSK